MSITTAVDIAGTPPAGPAPTDAYSEATAMAAAYTALEPLDEGARERALEWISTRLRAGQTTERYPF